MNTWLAFTSCLRATLETETPGTSVSSTIARRSACVRHTRFLPGSLTWCDCVSVSTIPLRGHDHFGPHTHISYSHSRSTHGENRTLTRRSTPRKPPNMRQPQRHHEN